MSLQLLLSTVATSGLRTKYSPRLCSSSNISNLCDTLNHRHTHSSLAYRYNATVITFVKLIPHKLKKINYKSIAANPKQNFSDCPKAFRLFLWITQNSRKCSFEGIKIFKRAYFPNFCTHKIAPTSVLEYLASHREFRSGHRRQPSGVELTFYACSVPARSMFRPVDR